ncbi:MAG: D-tyrosyl-tRNA(Tyr) deacylase, partial [Lachnospiraceae bacterium]|nr:D-tyrosyl-tRNA(Tyr) deacylase [Lachnospiraceae bacterium]
MRFVIQRVKKASVEIDSKIVGQIDKGFCVLIGIAETDTTEIADKLVSKMLGLRIFEDSNGKTNISLKDVEGELLLVSQFTLYADCKKGNRPSFIKAGNPQKATELYEYIIAKCRECGYKTETGE